MTNHLASGLRAPILERVKLKFWPLILVFAIAGCSSVPKPKPIPTGSLEKFEKKAEKFGEVVTVPAFETTTNEIAVTANNIIVFGNAALDRIGQLKPGEVNFTNIIRAIDDVGYIVQSAENRLDLIDQTSTNADVRDAASDAIKKIDA